MSLERLIYKYIVLNFARSWGVTPNSPRLADQNTDKTLLYDVNKLSAHDCVVAKLVKGRPRNSRRFHNGYCKKWNGGDRRDRTDDLKLAKLPLSQLSYVPS